MTPATKYSPWLYGLFFGLVGFVYVMAVTSRNHIGMSVDSADYLEITRNILDGQGITHETAGGEFELVTHWPPVYPLTVAFFSSLTGASPLDAARFGSAILLLLTLVVFNLIFRRYQVPTGAQVLLNLLVLLSFSTEVYLMAWSEPLFNLILLTTFYLFIRFLEGKDRRWLALAALGSGLLFLTRYAAVGFIGAFFIFLLFRKEKSSREKLTHLGIYTALTALLPLFWVIYAAGQSGNPTNRNLAVHLISPAHLRDFASTLVHWISPILPVISFPLLLLLTAGLIARALQTRQLAMKIPSLDEKSRLALLLAGTYLAFLLFSITFFDFHTELQNRILSPIFPFLLLLLIPILDWIRHRPGRRQYLFLAPFLLVLVSNAAFFYERSLAFYQEGIGYTGEWWKASATIAYLQEHPSDKVIITNGEEAIKVLTDRRKAVYSLPSRLSPTDQALNPDFDAELADLKTAVEAGNCLVVYFDKITHRYYLPEKEYLKKELAGRRFVELPDGLIIF